MSSYTNYIDKLIEDNNVKTRAMRLSSKQAALDKAGVSYQLEHEWAYSTPLWKRPWFQIMFALTAGAIILIGLAILAYSNRQQELPPPQTITEVVEVPVEVTRVVMETITEVVEGETVEVEVTSVVVEEVEVEVTRVVEIEVEKPILVTPTMTAQPTQTPAPTATATPSQTMVIDVTLSAWNSFSNFQTGNLTTTWSFPGQITVTTLINEIDQHDALIEPINGNFNDCSTDYGRVEIIEENGNLAVDFGNNRAGNHILTIACSYHTLNITWEGGNIPSGYCGVPELVDGTDIEGTALRADFFRISASNPVSFYLNNERTKVPTNWFEGGSVGWQFKISPQGHGQALMQAVDELCGTRSVPFQYVPR